eukprot:GHVU01028495.1.p3 GENE.GHVU01028495.1~~GHVU01028495.1.p3  ORF type:complete len:177 (-),score=12.86 GHVU01028495.1:1292-1822(-)
MSSQVINGCSERGGHPVRRELRQQWIVNLTSEAEPLLRGLEALDWPTFVKVQQRDWIGRRPGFEVDFPLTDSEGREQSFVSIFVDSPELIDLENGGQEAAVVLPICAAYSALLQSNKRRLVCLPRRRLLDPRGTFYKSSEKLIEGPVYELTHLFAVSGAGPILLHRRYAMHLLQRS